MTKLSASLAVALALLCPANPALSAQNPDAERKPDSTEEKKPDKEKTFEETSKRYINRWRLEKQDSSAPLSPPKQPIVFWLDNTIPVQYRTVTPFARAFSSGTTPSNESVFKTPSL